MDKNNRVLIGVILLIFITLLSFNLTSITGLSTKGKTVPSVSVSPKVAEAGERLTISVWTGKLGMHEQACLYDTDSRVSCTRRACSGNYKCYSTDTKQVSFNFAPATSLTPGVYSVCVWDYELAQTKTRAGDNSQKRGYVCGDFTLKSSREYYE